jgi:DNA polymerase-3 subunit gamma/tau
MSYQVSARKFRPGTFEDVVGQPHVVQMLVNALTNRRVAHAYLFSGTRGVGKTTIARILAKGLNCEQGPTVKPCGICASCMEITQGASVDVIEIDGASNTGVDDVREIRENVKFTPFRGGYRVYIIDEVHMLSTSAFNALLKTLEEPPAHVVFIFATTELHKIPATILSRCQHYHFRRIPRAEIVARLREIAQKDGIQIDDRSLAVLAKAGDGSMRDALSLFDQAVSFCGNTIQHHTLEGLLGAVPHELVRALVAAIGARNGAAAVRVLAEVVDQGHDMKAYCGDLVEYVRHLVVASVVPAAADLQGLIEVPPDDLRQLLVDVTLFSGDSLEEIFRLLTQAEDHLRMSPHPRYVLEVAAIRATRVENHVVVSPADRADGAREPRPTVSLPSSVPQSPGLSTPRTEKVIAKDDRRDPPQRMVKKETVVSASPEPFRIPGPSVPIESVGERPPLPQEAPSNVASGDASTASKKSPAPLQAQEPVPEASLLAQPTSTEIGTPLNWEAVLDRVAGVAPSVAAFLERGTFLGFEDDVVSIGYPATASVALGRIQNEENLRAVATVCAGLVGRSVRVRAMEISQDQAVGPSMAQIRADKVKQEEYSLLEKTRENPVIKQALHMFGSELTTVRHVVPTKEDAS